MIRIQNIYHMLAYAFRALRGESYRGMATEVFSNAADLCAAILVRGVSDQAKRGLGRGYIGVSEPLSSLRGKIDVTESLKNRSILRRQMVCSYDEFSVDTSMNRIIKATLVLLLRAEIPGARKKEIKRFLPLFSEVTDTSLSSANWHFSYNRNNQSYHMLMGICWLVCKGLLQTQSDGSIRLMDFFDEQRMCALYERFILEFFRQEHPEINVAAPYVKWALDDGFDDMLPVMKSDVTLTRGNRVLIIDAKYYANILQQRFDKQSVRSGNLYQIFTYVKNKEAELATIDHEVSGMLLYAKTDEEMQPDGVYRMSGNKISVKTLDLDAPFETIRAQLDAVVESHFS